MKTQQWKENPEKGEKSLTPERYKVEVYSISFEVNSFKASKMTNDPQLVHRKVAVLGFRAVGKTSLSNSFCNGTFDETYDPTIENTHHKIIRFRKVNFATDIVDTAGMDEYSRLSRSASVGVDGYVLVFSIISRQSFERIQHINENLLSALGDDISIPRVLVGSICDLSNERQVSYRDAKALADSWGVPYLECSSKTGENVNEVFHTVLREISKDDDILKENEENGCAIL